MEYDGSVSTDGTRSNARRNHGDRASPNVHLGRELKPKRSRKSKRKRDSQAAYKSKQHHEEDQDSDDVWNEFYSPQPDYDAVEGPIYVGHAAPPGNHYDEPVLEQQAVHDEAQVPVAAPGIVPLYDVEYETGIYAQEPIMEARPPRHGRRPSIIWEKPPNDKGHCGMWARAATRCPNKPQETYQLLLKLSLSRKADQYKSRPFKYVTRSENDTTFSRLLTKEYYGLKTEHTGLMQKITAYKKIAFVHFVQYRAERNSRYAFGKWTIHERVPIISRRGHMYRTFFMYQLSKRVRKESKIFKTLDGVPPPSKPTYGWVNRLDDLIEPGSVIDIEVEETFDTAKIYLGLVLAILLSLGVALAYGFTMDRDFATGFSIASWLLSAYAFFAAIVAAGEYFGLDKPTATLTARGGLRRGQPMYDTYG